MLRIKTKLGKSGLHGIGLFADQFIPKGTVTWKFDSRFDSAFTDAEVAGMHEHARAQFLSYAYFDKNIEKHVLCFDDQRFINHTEKNFNIQSAPEVDIAIRDINPGEELFCNYNHFDNTYFGRMNIDEGGLKSA